MCDPSSFIPDSIQHYELAIRAVMWALQCDEDKAEKTLLSLYGYSNKTQVKNAILQLAELREREVCEDYSKEELMKHLGHRYDVENGFKERLTKLMTSNKNPGEFKDRKLRLWDIELTGHEKNTAISFEVARNTYRVSEGLEQCCALTIDDYASLGRATQGELVVHFSSLGKALYEALGEILPDTRMYLVKDVDAIEEKAMAIIDRHPNNPFLRAQYLQWISDFEFQHSWAEDPKISDDELSRFPHSSRYFAEKRLSLVEETVASLKGFYGREWTKSADCRLAVYRADTFLFPALLYWAAKYALNAGRLDLAGRWLKENYRITPADNFGSRYYLALLDVIHQSYKQNNYIKSEKCGMWGQYLAAVIAFNKQDLPGCVLEFSKTLKYSHAFFAVLNDSEYDWSQFRILSNLESIAYARELDHYLLKHLKPYKEMREYLVELCRQPGVFEAVIEYEQARDAYTGGFKEEERRELRYKKLERCLTQF